jgi:uncharacterized membrane protein
VTWLSSARERLRTSYWFLPLVLTGGASLLALALIEVDRRLDRSEADFVFTGGADSAREVLSTIASTVLTFTGLVFTITVVVLQLASSQFSPRVLRTFLRDRASQAVLGVFIATFAYALIALRAVRGEDGDLVDAFVPGVTVNVAFLLVALSLGTFVYFIHHVAQSIRVVNVIAAIADETRRAVARIHPAEPDAAVPPRRPAVPGRTVHAASSGVVAGIDVDGLLDAGKRSGCDVTVVPLVGSFVPEGAPLLVLSQPTDSDREEVDDDVVRRAVLLSRERTLHQDVAFGVRQLVDVAERALSPGVNDPSTAVQCLDQLHVILRLLGTRPWPPDTWSADESDVVVQIRRPQWDGYVALALDEIRHWGADSLQVQRRIESMLRDLLTAVRPDRQEVLHHQLALLEASRRRAIPAEELRDLPSADLSSGAGR